MYLFAMVMFAIITAYMIVSLIKMPDAKDSEAVTDQTFRIQFAAFFITVKGIINAKNAIEADGGKLSMQAIS